MPLSFESRSHGPVAFGFFNIESDMLLLERTFFSATISAHGSRHWRDRNPRPCLTARCL
jgi:hypothetical protein